MICVFADVTERRRRHNVSGGIKCLAAAHHVIERLSNCVQIDPLPDQRTKLSLKRLPRFDPIEELEQHRAKEDFRRRRRTLGMILDLSDEILADAIAYAVGVRKSKGR